MASKVDDFLINFDLNQLGIGETVQTPQPNYEKLRKTTHLLKKKIISTDFVVQSYLAKKEDYNQALKAHSLTKEDLKQACINYKNASEKCLQLEQDIKLSQANQEALQIRATDAEVKHNALLSHSNQLQALVNELKTENEALVIEKKLDSNSSQVLQLQKEKEALCKNILALEEVILHQKKKGKQHLQILEESSCLKKSHIYTSDENSDDETHSQLSYSKSKSHKNKKAISNMEPDYIDNDSDTSNEEVSIDTGCGSSHSNSDKYDLNSPEHYNFEGPLKLTDNSLVKHIEVATSPIKVYESVSVSTSPIVFDTSVPIFEDNDNDAVDTCDDTYTIYAIMEDKNVLVDACTSPITIFPEFNRLTDVGTSPIKELNNITTIKYVEKPKSLFSDLHEDSETKQKEIVSEKKFVTCLCQKSNVITIQTKLIDVCTSPIAEFSSICFPEKNTSDKTVAHDNLNQCHEISGMTSLHNCANEKEIHDTNMLEKQATKSYCDKFTSTDITVTEQEIVDACTSPVLTSIDKCQAVDKDTSSVYVAECSQYSQNENSHQEELESSATIKQTHIRVSENENLNQINFTQEFNNTQEKICLENNNSKNVCYDTNDDDAEVQNILHMMKFRRNFISPIPNSPPNIQLNSNYFNMHIKNIYELIEKCNNNIKNVHNDVEVMKKRGTVNFHNSSSEIEGTESYNEKETDGQQCKITNRDVNGEAEEEEEEYISDIIVLSNTDNCNISYGYENLNMLEVSPHITRDIAMNINSETVITANNTPRINEMDKYQNQSQYNYTSQIKDKGLFEVIEDETVDISLENQSKNNISDIKMCNLNMSKISAPKTKNKSKLQKLRDKMLPVSKIKKMTPISKKVKVRKNLSEITSPSVKQRIAYENAVKVMNELKSKQTTKIQSKTKLSTNQNISTGSEANLDEIESPLFYSNTISTRSRTSRLSEKEDDATVTVSPKKLAIVEKSTCDVEKSPSSRKARKRPAENTLNNLQSSRKRVLRSSKDNIIFSTAHIEIAPCDDEIEFKTVTCSENVGNLIELGKELCNSRDSQVDKINSIDPSNEEQEEGLTLTQNDLMLSVESSHISNVMIDKGDKSIETNESLKKPYVNDDQAVTFLNNDAVDVNVKQQNDCSTVNKNVQIAELLNDNNLSITEQSEENCILKSTDNARLIGTVENQKGLNQNNIQNGTNALDHKLKENAILNMRLKNPVVELIPLREDVIANYKKRTVSYSDLDIYSVDASSDKTVQNVPSIENQYIKENILCDALERYGVNKVKITAKKIPETVTNTICQKIEQSIADIIASPKDHQKNKMNQLIHSIQSFKTKQILAGLIKYLKDPTRKCELYNTVNNGSAPPMTRSEVILLYVIEHLNVFLVSGNFIHNIYANIEHTLFQLNHSPNFDTIESMSHFYAVMCRYFRNKSRLRCFMLDAMYCLQFKAVPLIKQCLDVCPGVLPYAHEHMAKTSLVTCLVYLLHFYKCTDKYNRVQEIRNILSRKYHYRFSEWNETMILEIFRKAIMNLRDLHNDKKMLRLALIILCKRHGANWCQTKIIQNMLLPIIQQPAVPEKIKQFCVLMLGPLLKPFPADKKAQCEIVINQLLQLLKHNPSHEMQEAVYSSLIFMSKHDQERVVQALLSWNPAKVSNDFQDILNDYVMDRPLSVWKKLVTKPSQCT